jgi:hypothetical protein
MHCLVSIDRESGMYFSPLLSSLKPFSTSTAMVAADILASTACRLPIPAHHLHHPLWHTNKAMVSLEQRQSTGKEREEN